jgi:hypothetical protein
VGTNTTAHAKAQAERQTVHSMKAFVEVAWNQLEGHEGFREALATVGLSVTNTLDGLCWVADPLFSIPDHDVKLSHLAVYILEMIADIIIEDHEVLTERMDTLIKHHCPEWEPPAAVPDVPENPDAPADPPANPDDDEEGKADAAQSGGDGTQVQPEEGKDHMEEDAADEEEEELIEEEEDEVSHAENPDEAAAGAPKPPEPATPMINMAVIPCTKTGCDAIFHLECFKPGNLVRGTTEVAMVGDRMGFFCCPTHMDHASLYPLGEFWQKVSFVVANWRQLRESIITWRRSTPQPRVPTGLLVDSDIFRMNLSETIGLQLVCHSLGSVGPAMSGYALITA